MFERFTDRGRRVLGLAQEEARLLNHAFIGTEHLLLGLIHEGDGVAAQVLEQLGISLQDVRNKVEGEVHPGSAAPTGSPPFTPRAKKVLELSLREALQLGHNYIGTEHLLLGLIREGEGVAAKLLQSLGADLAAVRERVILLLSSDEGRDRVRSGRSGLRRHEPRHPQRVIPGPNLSLSSDGLEFRVVGLLLFSEGTRVLWRVAGIPKAIGDLIGVQAFTPLVQRGSLVSYVTVTDDLGTDYVLSGSMVEMQQDSECAGSLFVKPAVPETASQLSVRWQEQVLNIELGSVH